MADAKSDFTKIQYDQALREFKKVKLSLHEKSAFIEELEEEIKKFNNNDDQQLIVNKIQLLRETRVLTDNDWEEYYRVFNEIHPSFFHNIKNNVDPSSGDRRQLIFLKLDLKQKECTHLMGVSSEGVKRARQRLSKKIGLHDAWGDTIIGEIPANCPVSGYCEWISTII